MKPELVAESIINIITEDGRNIDDIDVIGSVALGTYDKNTTPDIDIVIVTKFMKQNYKHVKEIFPNGYPKKGELTIWHMPNYAGFPVDIVIVHPNNLVTRGLKHVRYFRGKLTLEEKALIIKLKRFFKRINCYGAETGGITGIALTALVYHYKSWKGVFKFFENLQYEEKESFFPDPVDEKRNLLASILPFRWSMIMKCVWNDENDVLSPLVDEKFLMKKYMNVLSIPIHKHIGKDIQFQKLHSGFTKAWGELKNKIRWWSPWISYNIYFSDTHMYVGYMLTPQKITKTRYDTIPMDLISKKTREKLLTTEGSSYDAENNIIRYPRHPPFARVNPEFEKLFADRLAMQGVGWQKGTQGHQGGKVVTSPMFAKWTILK